MSLGQWNQTRINFLNQHRRPVTRREFVAKGLIAGGTAYLAPSLGSLLVTREARAQEKPLSTIPFLVFDLAGGAALSANFLVGKKGGPEDLLKSYDDLGWNPRQTQLQRRFGIPMAGNGISGMLNGLLETASEAALKNFRLGTLLHIASPDTSANPLSALSLVGSAGNIGNSLSVPAGLRNTQSGGNSRYALETDKQRAYYLNKLGDLTSAVGLNTNFDAFSLKAKNKLGSMLNRLSTLQAQRLMSSPVTDETLKAIDQNYARTTEKMSSSLNLDPRKDAKVAALYGLNAQTQLNNPSLMRAALVNAIVQREVGAGVITFEGCDYHDNTQTTGDAKDLEVGRDVGRAIEMAYQTQTPLFFQMITDGGIYPHKGSRIWSGDNVDNCMTVIGYYHPTKAPEYYKGRMQIGAFTDQQGADRSTLIGESPLFAAYGVFVNYMAVTGRLGEVEKMLPALNKDQIDSMLIFEGT